MILLAEDLVDSSAWASMIIAFVSPTDRDDQGATTTIQAKLQLK